MAKKKRTSTRRTNVISRNRIITLPVLPLRDLVMCPEMVVPIAINRPLSISAVHYSHERYDDRIILATQKSFDTDVPQYDDLYPTACIGRILEYIEIEEDVLKVLVEGIIPVHLKASNYYGDPDPREKDYFILAESKVISDKSTHSKQEIVAIARTAKELFEEYTLLNPRLPEDATRSLCSVEQHGKLLYLLTAYISIKPEEKLELLGYSDPYDAFMQLCKFLSREIELLNIEGRIQQEVRTKLDDQQKSYFLNEQIRAIERELGDEEYDEIEEYAQKIEDAHMPEDVENVALTELSKLKKTPSFSPESAVTRNYLDWLVSLPWAKKTEDNLNIKHARTVLDNSHYGLKEPKERILEYLAVREMHVRYKKELQKTAVAENAIHPTHASTVLCLVGPPGVGKTSLARAIAEALGRTFVRISLGGVRDESEIRGHRRTYVGALPGRIIQGLKKAGKKNPVMLLDEIDKLYADFRGDPSSALLEVLDPEQNSAFNDHYLEVDVDLSSVIFICTANVEDTIHPTLRDRLEKIEISSYTEKEKCEIASRFLVDIEKTRAGIPLQVDFSTHTITSLIRNYTNEAGVRNLNREIAKVMRKCAMNIVTSSRKRKKIVITPKKLPELLGPPTHHIDLELPASVSGLAIGLAWTETGGDILKIEATVYEGKGELTLTGQLGDVMQESARAAFTYVRQNRRHIGLSAKYFNTHDIHIHVPEGAIPKDGPSAGITIATALYSALSNQPVKEKLAMTGEITLGGIVLPVGGLKEKLLAAHRIGVKTVIIPARNESDLAKIPDDVKKELTIHMVSEMDDVVALTFDKERKKATRKKAVKKSVKKTVKKTGKRRRPQTRT